MLRIENRGRVRLLTFDRPDSLNAFNDDMYDAITAALHQAEEDSNVAVIVLTGEGRAFCAGQDLAELDSPRTHKDDQRHGFDPFIEALEAFPKPIIAAVNGIGVGIGLTMLPHCDLVLIAEGAKLRAPFLTLGVTAEAGSTVLLPAMLGWAQTAHLLYTSSWVDAEKAIEIGLAWKKVSPESLMEEAFRVADEMAVMPIASLVGTKKLLLASRLEAVRIGRARETVTFQSLVRGPANKEALAAFREKRDPDFSKL